MADGYRQQSAETEWIDDPRPHRGDDEHASQGQTLRERYEQLRAQQAQAELQERLDSTTVWDKESYAEILERRLKLFYAQHLQEGIEHPDAKRALAHFAGNVEALNKALKAKYGADLDDAARRQAQQGGCEAPRAAADGPEQRGETSHRRPGTICQCVADFVDAPASPFAAVGVKSKDFSLKKLHCGKGGACQSLGEVGQSLWEIPGSTVAGFSEGFKHTRSAVSEGPQMAVNGIETAFRHKPPRPKTEGYV